MQFVRRLKTLQETRRKNQRARNQIVQELRKLTGPQVATVDEAAVRDRLKALRELDERSAADLRRAYDSLDEVLDVRQQARFRIFEETDRAAEDGLAYSRSAARRRPRRTRGDSAVDRACPDRIPQNLATIDSWAGVPLSGCSVH